MNKVCMVCGSFPNTHCGVGDYTRYLVRQLSRSGEAVTVLTTQGQVVEPVKDVTIDASVKHWKLIYLPKIFRSLKKINPAIIHIQYPSVGYGKGLAVNLLIPLLKFFNPHVKTIMTLHEYNMFSWAGRIRVWLSIKWADHVIFTNEYDAQQAKLSMKRILSSVIHLGNSLSAVKIVATSHLRGKKINLIHFGTMMPNKGWPDMIAALVRLKQASLEVTLTAICGIEPERYAFHRFVQKLIDQAGLNEQINFTGFLSPSAIDQVMEKDAIVIMPFVDGLKLNRSSFIAMLGYGKAIVTTRPDHQVEGIVNDETCKFIPKNDSQSLAETIEDLWHNQKKCMQLGKGAQQAAQQFDWTLIGEQTIKLYNDLKKITTKAYP